MEAESANSQSEAINRQTKSALSRAVLRQVRPTQASTPAARRIKKATNAKNVTVTEIRA